MLNGFHNLYYFAYNEILEKKKRESQKKEEKKSRPGNVYHSMKSTKKKHKWKTNNSCKVKSSIMGIYLIKHSSNSINISIVMTVKMPTDSMYI